MTLMQGAQGFFPGAEDGTDFVDLVSGSLVLTLDGALPAEHLSPGDRIITRSGMRRLAGISSRERRGATVRLGAADRPVWADQPVHLRGGVAMLDCGRPAADVPAVRLSDATPGQATRRRVRLRFEGPVVIYADGLELVSRRDDSR